MKLCIVKFSPLSFYLVPLRYKYSPQHPTLKPPRTTFLPRLPLLDILNLKILRYLELENIKVIKLFLFNLLRINGIYEYMFRALLSHPQEALQKRHLVYCVRVMSVGCIGIGVANCRQLTHECVKVVNPKHRAPLPPRNYFWYSFLLEAANPSAIVRPEGLC
jgi:hypothetical protein